MPKLLKVLKGCLSYLGHLKGESMVWWTKSGTCKVHTRVHNYFNPFVKPSHNSNIFIILIFESS